MKKIKNKEIFVASAIVLIIALATFLLLCSYNFVVDHYYIEYATPMEVKTEMTTNSEVKDIDILGGAIMDVASNKAAADVSELKAEVAAERETIETVIPSTEAPLNIIYSEDTDNYDYAPYTHSSDLELLARVTYLEGGSTSEECQRLIASTALNLADQVGSLQDVVYDYNTFNVAEAIDSCSPNILSYAIAERVLEGERDYNVIAFRTNYYHSFGTPYKSIDNVYFSTN